MSALTRTGQSVKFPLSQTPLFFGPHVVTNQVFHLTPLTMSLVNIRPLVRGHILVTPRRLCARLSGLTPAETADLFTTAILVSKTLERVYGAEGFNLAVQDGAAAGQTVATVHAHVLPRRRGDFGGVEDRVYDELSDWEAGAGKSSEDAKEKVQKQQQNARLDDCSRVDRSAEDMQAEAEMLAREMAQESPSRAPSDNM